VAASNATGFNTFGRPSPEVPTVRMRPARRGANGRPRGCEPLRKPQVSVWLHRWDVDDLRLGIAFRAARIRRGLRQADLALASGVSDSTISRLEQGELAGLSVASVRTIAAKLSIRLDLVPRWRGGDLDRLVSARHASLGESVAAWIALQTGWSVVAEVSFAIYGERGIIDLLAWHRLAGLLVVIELKTAILDVDELLGTLDRKRRLASRIAADRGWRANSTRAWLLVADSRTNRRRIGAHGILFRSALPGDGRMLTRLFRHPEAGPVSGIGFWPDSPGAGIGRSFSARQRVCRRRATDASSKPRSPVGE
jgi:transcriptional regulator with XRE-family HTH domain